LPAFWASSINCTGELLEGDFSTTKASFFYVARSNPASESIVCVCILRLKTGLNIQFHMREESSDRKVQELSSIVEAIISLVDNGKKVLTIDSSKETSMALLPYKKK
jgi:hypothetical protein